MNKFQVFLNNEYGYKTYIWTPNMTKEEFVNWWKNITDSDIIKYYFNIKALPGKLTPVEVTKEGTSRQRVYGDPKDYTPDHYCHLSDVYDSFVSIGDEKFYHTRIYKRDWKEYWIDYQIKADSASAIYPEYST
jgi:hypothetical protein